MSLVIVESALKQTKWCPEPESNRHAAFAARDFLTTSAFAAFTFVVWSTPSP